MSYLFERKDFPDLVNAAGIAVGIGNPAIVEKDYYVVEALRLIASRFGDVVVFKGGTSLSKGWKIIDRFSEDIDLYVRPDVSEETTLTRFESLADIVGAFPGFTGRKGRSDKGSSSWTEEFSYQSQVPALGGIRAVVLLEAGIQSADQPTEGRMLTSMIGETLDARHIDSSTDDRQPFQMQLLHFRRTFVEKLFTLHSRVERAVRQERDLGRDARHYYDLSMLLQRQETLDMLGSSEYADICKEYRELTWKFFPGQVKLLPELMNLAGSQALFPENGLRDRLAAAYVRESQSLCYGEYPSFGDVLEGFAKIRGELSIAV